MKPKPKLRLYVWEYFSPDYTSGLAFAIASTEGDARKQIKKVYGDPHQWGDLTIHRLDRRTAYAVGGGG